MKELIAIERLLEESLKELRAVERLDHRPDQSYRLDELKAFTRRYCKEHGTSQGDLAMLSGIHDNTLTQALKAPTSSSMTTIHNILDSMGLELCFKEKKVKYD